MAKPFKPMSEGAVVRTLLVYAGEFGVKLFRNHRGVHKLAQKDCKSCQRWGVTISAGLTNGMPDTVGWMPVVIGPEHLGQTFARFVAVEAKREDGGTVSEDQRRVLGILERDGALCGVARSIADLEGILRPETATSCGIRQA